MTAAIRSFVRSWGAPLAVVCLISAAEAFSEIDGFLGTVALIVIAAALIPFFSQDDRP